MSTIVTDKIHTTELINATHNSIVLLDKEVEKAKAELAQLKTERKTLKANLQKEHAAEFDSLVSAIDTKIYEAQQKIRSVKAMIKTCYTNIDSLSKHKIANDGFKRYCVECGEVITQ